jgi:hypothetical protein
MMSMIRTHEVEETNMTLADDDKAAVVQVLTDY